MWYLRQFVRVGAALLVLLLAVSGARAQAVNEFSTSLNVIYTVQDTGQTQVKYEVRLKNLFSTVYARQYALEVNSPNIQNISVKDVAGNPLAFTATQGVNTSTIAVTFGEAQKVVGRDKELLFFVTYESTDSAAAIGRVLEVNIPKLAKPESFTQYNVVIAVPKKFGPPTLVEPAQYTLDSTDSDQILRFTNTGQNTGITVLFGESQTYWAQLQYHVENKAQNVGIVQVALPPDTPWQRVQYANITPQPESIEVDEDGNWIAEFRVAGQAQQTIQVTGLITLFAQPKVPVPNENPLKTFSSKSAERSPYLRSTEFWPTDNAVVRSVVKDRQTPRELYQYTVDTLQYNFKRFEQPDATHRLGAAAALEDPANAVCQEFSDVFIALARAAGVPARRATGYAITENSRLRPLSLVADVLHAWPEYYDVQRNLWVPIDPTWSDTTGGVDYFSKLDLRHITFARQGQYPDRPAPAGTYKLPGKEEKDIVVRIATDADLASVGLASQSGEVPKQLSVEKQASLLPRFGLPTKEEFTLRNESGAALYNTEIAVGVEGNVSLLSPPTVTVPVWLPYQTITVPVELSASDLWRPQPATVTLLMGEERYAYEVTAGHAFISQKYAPIFAVGSGVALLSLGAGCVLVCFRRWRSHLRR